MEDINTNDQGSPIVGVSTDIPTCEMCDEEVGTDQYPTARWALGYTICKDCGDEIASRTVRTVVPMHKSNYFLCTNLEDLKGINNKGGLVK